MCWVSFVGFRVAQPNLQFFIKLSPFNLPDKQCIFYVLGFGSLNPTYDVAILTYWIRDIRIFVGWVERSETQQKPLCLPIILAYLE